MFSFGPVPSRRLGRSLGINNIPPKICTFACVYCQLGRTIQMRIERQAFHDPAAILEDVEARVKRAADAGEPIDYLTFVPDGEPTLEINLGREIEMLKPLGIKIGIITNSSLIWHPDVREDLAQADWVSVKVDAVREEIWRKIDRPHGALRLDMVLAGLREFAATYAGTLVTETMLVKGVNDTIDHAQELAVFLGELSPSTAYLGVPTRPPAEEWVRPPDEERINHIYQIVSEQVGRVEYLVGYEGNAFAFTGNVEEDILSITSVHPMREDAVAEFLDRASSDWSAIHDLIHRDQLIETEYEGKRYYLRRLHPRT